MHCKKCKAEWTQGSAESRLSTCPFCGASFVSDMGKSDELTMQDVVSKIVECYGPEIIAQEKRFLAVFKDFAPKLRHEHKILKIAFGEDIAGFFLDCPVEFRAARTEEAIRALDAILSKEASESVVMAFSKALGWTEISARPAKQPAQGLWGLLKSLGRTGISTDTTASQDEKIDLQAETMNLIESFRSCANAQKAASNATVTEEPDNDEGRNRSAQRTASAASVLRLAGGDFLKKGTECRNKGRYDEAARWYQKAADLGNAYAKRALMQIEMEQRDLIDQGDKYRKQGKLEAAIKCYQSAADKGSTKAKDSLTQVFLDQGRNYRRLGKIQKTIEFCQKALQLGSTEAQNELLKVQEISAELVQGEKLRRQGKLDEAMAAYKKALNEGYPKAKDAVSSITLEKKGYDAYNSGDIENAMKYYQMAIDSGGDAARETIAETMYGEGCRCYDCGLVEDSVKWLKLAVKNGNDSIKTKIADMCKSVIESGNWQAIRNLAQVISEKEIKEYLQHDPTIAKPLEKAVDDCDKEDDIAELKLLFYQLVPWRKFVKAYNALARKKFRGYEEREAQTAFGKRFAVCAFSCSNKETRMNHPDLPPEFSDEPSMTIGEYWAMPLANGLYAVVPNMKKSYDLYIHAQGGMKEAFESNFESGKTYDEIQVLQPAFFRKGWVLVSPGKLELSN